MAKQRLKARDKKVQKMTRNGLVEENLADNSSVRVSNRAGDMRLSRKSEIMKGDIIQEHPQINPVEKKGNRRSGINRTRSRDAPVKAEEIRSDVSEVQNMDQRQSKAEIRSGRKLRQRKQIRQGIRTKENSVAGQNVTGQQRSRNQITRGSIVRKNSNFNLRSSDSGKETLERLNPSESNFREARKERLHRQRKKYPSEDRKIVQAEDSSKLKLRSNEHGEKLYEKHVNVAEFRGKTRKERARHNLQRNKKIRQTIREKPFIEKEFEQVPVKESEENTSKSKLKTADKRGQLYEKHRDVSESRGDSRKEKTGGTKRPQQKRRLQFAKEETGAKDASLKEPDSKNKISKYEIAKEKAKRLSYKAEKAEGKIPKKHSIKELVYQEHGEPVKKRKLRFEETPDLKAGKSSSIKKLGDVADVAVHRQVSKYEDDNSAVQGSHAVEKSAENIYRLRETGIRHINQRRVSRAQKLRIRADKAEVKAIYTKALAEDAKLQNSSHLKKLIQKQRIKHDYAKAKQAEQSVGTATVGTIDYIKKIGGKVTDFFKENRKVYISIALLLALMLLIAACFTSCSSMFMQNLVNYTGVSYMSTDDAIRQADLYYTQLEANLQEQINHMQEEESGYDQYRYNIAPIEHDPFVLMSYLSAKYEIFTFDQVKSELDTLFALQYGLSTQSVNETVTDTHTVRVGESLGQVVTSGYCACSICCGVWAGSPTASGVYPTANHTIAVDAYNPIVPMGTKIVMNGVEYTVEDTGAFASYGVAFDVYYDDHNAALNHGHRTWEAFIADSNGSQEVEVTSTRNINVLNVTLSNNSLMGICQNRLGTFEKELFSAYNHVKGNLQMFATPLDFNWYSRVSSYYGYRLNPFTGENQMHNGLDIAAPEGTTVKAGLDGRVTESSYNDSYGNYVVIKDKDGYELRYAHLSSRSVSAGSSITRDDEIGKVGSTGNSTGPHLHIELLINGERTNPIFYLETGSGTMFGGAEITSSQARRMLEEADRYLGVPYVWGGYSPSGFDCSGFVSYVLNNSGVRNWGRLTAQGLYDHCTPVNPSDAQPGDLIFFTGTYDAGEPVTHVGIYVGNGNMIHCGEPVQYASIYSPYWQTHFYAFGRP